MILVQLVCRCIALPASETLPRLSSLNKTKTSRCVEKSLVVSSTAWLMTIPPCESSGLWSLARPARRKLSSEPDAARDDSPR
jgi:hypothetical protein